MKCYLCRIVRREKIIPTPSAVERAESQLMLPCKKNCTGTLTAKAISPAIAPAIKYASCKSIPLFFG